MIELYKMMQQVQGKPIPTDPVHATLNLKEDFQFLLDYFNSIKIKPDFPENYGSDMDIFYFHRDEQNVNQISKAYNIPIEEVKKWVHDDRYKNLVEQKMTSIALPADLLKKSYDVCSTLFNLREDLVVAFWTQRPGQMAPLHYDRKKHVYFNVDQSKADKIKRYIVFLDDQKEGQVFYMAGHNVSWKAGDVLSWNQIYYQHGSANFGYEERPNLLITGVEN